MPAELFAAAVLTVYGAKLLQFLAEEQGAVVPPSTAARPVKASVDPIEPTIVIPGDAALAMALCRQVVDPATVLDVEEIEPDPDLAEENQ